MAKSIYLQDDQRITLAKDWLKAVAHPNLEKDSTSQEIGALFKQYLALLEEWKDYEKGFSRMEEADTRLDACVQGLSSTVDAIERKAFVKNDGELLEKTQKVQKTLFPSGLSAIIYVPYKAEASQVQTFLNEAQKPHVAEFLKAHRLEEWLTLTAQSHQDYIQALNEFRGSKEERKELAEQVSAARRLLNKTFTRFLRYTRSKFPDEHALASWRQEYIEAPRERAVAAALALRK